MKVRDLVEYLEMKITDHTASDDECELYAEYQTIGVATFYENKRLTNKLIRDYESTFEEDR